MLSPHNLQALWYGKHPLSWLLLPLSCLYILLIKLRQLAYASGILPVQRLAIPVIVVGNVTVGGTGKTPLIIWLSKFLQSHGYRPGIVSRGYGGMDLNQPQQVRPDSNPMLVGDEPVLIAQRTTVPVAISSKRYLAAKELIEQTECNVLLCDDGLQHYSLDRDIEIAVIDGERQYGNGHCLPAGPLREPISRLDSVDMVVGNGHASKHQYLMEFRLLPLRSLKDEGLHRDLDSFVNQDVHAVAGIGNPDRFFNMLRRSGVRVIKHAFPDHHQFQSQDLVFDDELPVLMTEKDAVKCRSLAKEHFWYLPIEAIMSDAFEHRILTLLKETTYG